MVAVTFVPGMASIMAAGWPHRLSCQRFFNKSSAEIATMPLLRAFLFLTASAAIALAQTAPLPNTGEVVLMQSTPDGARPSRIRVLAAADHDLFLRAFEAAGRGDWKMARALAAQGQNPIARRLLEWRYALDKNSGATFAEIDAVIKDTESTTSAGTWPL